MHDGKTEQIEFGDKDRAFLYAKTWFNQNDYKSVTISKEKI